MFLLKDISISPVSMGWKRIGCDDVPASSNGRNRAKTENTAKELIIFNKIEIFERKTPQEKPINPCYIAFRMRE
jgi:hypothetical protein